MFIPKPSSQPSQRQQVPLELTSGHLRLHADLVEQFLGTERNALIRYDAEETSVWLARQDDLAFKTKSGVAQCMVKEKNLHGDCSIAIGEILLDEELPKQDRPLTFTFHAESAQLAISLDHPNS